jgi:hypothetical protein
MAAPVAAIHQHDKRRRAWMAGTSPAMTSSLSIGPRGFADFSHAGEFTLCAIMRETVPKKTKAPG